MNSIVCILVIFISAFYGAQSRIPEIGIYPIDGINPVIVPRTKGIKNFTIPKTTTTTRTTITTTTTTTQKPVGVDAILKAVGINRTRLFQISDWINLCQIRLREANSFRGFFKAIEASENCQVTLNDAIVETRIYLNGGQWQCSWSSNSFVANTDLSFYKLIEKKYNDAISLAVDDTQYSLDTIAALKTEHLFSIKTNKNTGQMFANCRTIPTKSGFSCDLTLQARVKYHL